MHSPDLCLHFIICTEMSYIHLLLQRNPRVHPLPHHRKAFLWHSKLFPSSCQRAGPGSWRAQPFRGRGRSVPLCAVKLHCWQRETEKVSHHIYTVLRPRGIRTGQFDLDRHQTYVHGKNFHGAGSLLTTKDNTFCSDRHHRGHYRRHHPHLLSL